MPLITPASGTRRAPKWTRIELQVINLSKAPLERGVLSQAFVFICQDMYSDMGRQAIGVLNGVHVFFVSLGLGNKTWGFSKTSCVLFEPDAPSLSYRWLCSHATEEQNVSSAHFTAKTVELMD